MSIPLDNQLHDIPTYLSLEDISTLRQVNKEYREHLTDEDIKRSLSGSDEALAYAIRHDDLEMFHRYLETMTPERYEKIYRERCHIADDIHLCDWYLAFNEVCFVEAVCALSEKIACALLGNELDTDKIDLENIVDDSGDNFYLNCGNLILKSDEFARIFASSLPLVLFEALPKDMHVKVICRLLTYGHMYADQLGDLIGEIFFSSTELESIQDRYANIIINLVKDPETRELLEVLVKHSDNIDG